MTANTSDGDLTSLTVVLPCRNEGSSIGEVVTRLRNEFAELPVELDLVVVDDGSSDDTLDVLRSLAGTDLRYISLSRNFGKEAAMLAGLQRARGSVVVLMDGDMQHPPELVRVLVDKYLETRADQVIALRSRTGDPLMRRLSAAVYFRLINRFVDVRLIDGAGDFRLLSRRAVDALLELTERTRFSKGLFAWIGYPTTVVEYANQERIAGQSSWTLRSLVDYGLDGAMSFNTRPLRSMVSIGIAASAAFVAYLGWLVIDAAVSGIVTPGYITLVAIVVFLGGLQLLCIGVVGEYVGRIYLEVKARPHYLIGEEGPGEPCSSVE
jgi:glycosyltransferase involved in cell wall biosynthesis